MKSDRGRRLQRRRPLLFLRALCAAALLWSAAAPLAAQQFRPLREPYNRMDVAVDGTVFLLSTTGCTLTRIPADGSAPATIGGPGWLEGQFDAPADVWARNGVDILVADEGNHRIQRYDRSLAFVASLFLRDDPVPEKRFGYPRGVALSRLGDLFMSDGENVRGLKVIGFRNVERAFGTFGGGKGKLAAPTMVDVGPDDMVYVLDGRRIVVFDTFGNYLHDVPPAHFTRPSALAADERGAVVLDDTLVYVIDRAGKIAGRVGTGSLGVHHPLRPRDIALAGGRLYLLFADGYAVCPDPRDGILDSHRKSE